MGEGERLSVILACLGLYLLLCVGVGLWALRRTRSVGDFFVAGRRLGFVVTAVAIFSSIMSGFAFVGGPGLVYLTGQHVPLADGMIVPCEIVAVQDYDLVAVALD